MTAHLIDESHRLAPWRRWLETALDTANEDALVDTTLESLTEGVEYDEGKVVSRAVALTPICAAESLAERLEIAATLLRRRLEQVSVGRSDHEPRPQHATDETRDRGVAVELLADEITALRDAALRHARADGATAAGSGLDLETAAIRYVRKLDDELRKASAIDYAAIAAAADGNGPADN
jgi:hypothetical protein